MGIRLMAIVVLVVCATGCKSTRSAGDAVLRDGGWPVFGTRYVLELPEVDVTTGRRAFTLRHVPKVPLGMHVEFDSDPTEAERKEIQVGVEVRDANGVSLVAHATRPLSEWRLSEWGPGRDHYFPPNPAMVEIPRTCEVILVVGAPEGAAKRRARVVFYGGGFGTL